LNALGLNTRCLVARKYRLVQFQLRFRTNPWRPLSRRATKSIETERETKPGFSIRASLVGAKTPA
jgi:hypothetical protein